MSSRPGAFQHRINHVFLNKRYKHAVANEAFFYADVANIDLSMSMFKEAIIDTLFSCNTAFSQRTGKNIQNIAIQVLVGLGSTRSVVAFNVMTVDNYKAMLNIELSKLSRFLGEIVKIEIKFT